jgi:hypothetical protein
MMLEIVVVICKLGTKAKPSKRSQSENGQTTYHILLTISVGKHVDQIYENLSRVTIPISKP